MQQNKGRGEIAAWKVTPAISWDVRAADASLRLTSSCNQHSPVLLLRATQEKSFVIVVAAVEQPLHWVLVIVLRYVSQWSEVALGGQGLPSSTFLPSGCLRIHSTVKSDIFRGSQNVIY